MTLLEYGADTNIETAPYRPPSLPPNVAVEQWRSLAAQYFPPDQVDKVLHVIAGESSGNPAAVGDGGAAYGLFQSHYVAKNSTPEQQFADAARLYQSDLKNGGTGFGDWGEGRLYNGQPFGALGRTPYASPMQSGTATATQLPAVQATPIEATPFTSAQPALDTMTSATTPSRPAFTPAFQGGEATAAVQPARIAEPLVAQQPAYTDTSKSAQGLISGADPSVQPHLQSVYDAAIAGGKDALTEVQQAIKDVGGTPHTATPLATGPGTPPLIPRTPGQALAAIGGLGAAATNIAEPAIETLPKPLQEPARQGVGLAANIAIGPGSLASKAAQVGASLAGGELTQKAGVGRTVGQLAGGLAPAGATGIAATLRGEGTGVIKNLAEEGAGATKPPATPVDQLIQHIESAGAKRPDLLAARKAELGRRFAAAVADIEAGGVPANEAFARARQQLAGEIADQSFVPPTALDSTPLHQQIVDYVKQTGDFTTGNNASEGLKRLERGIIPRSFEVRDLGKVFGADLQTAISDLGDVFKVKSLVEDHFTGRGPIPLSQTGELTSTSIADTVASVLPKGSNPKAVKDAVQQLVNEERLVVGVDSAGKPVLRLRGPQVNALDEAIRAEAAPNLNPEPVPNQTKPPVQRGFEALPPPPKGTDVPYFKWQPGKNRPLWQEAGKFGLDAFGLGMRAFQTAFDYSYPLRQGAWLGAKHEKEFWANFAKGFRALYDDKYALARQAQIERAPFNPANLDITHWQPGQKLTDMEEGFMSRLANIVPGIKQSNRAATVFINGLRSDVVNTVARTELRNGRTLEQIKPDLEVFANYVNRATGRGNLGNFESSLPALNQVFYGLRRNVAMVQVPGYLFNKSPLIRKEAWGDFLAFMGVGLATLKLADLAGADVGIDPTSGDFGKIRVGNTRVDIWGGYQQLARLVYRVADGQVKDAGSVQNFGDAVFPFLGNKLAPAPGAALKQYDPTRNLLYPGQAQPSATSAAANAFAPLAFAGLVDAIREDGAKGGAIALTSFFGTGTQSYTATQDIGANEIADGVKSGLLPATFIDKNGQSQPVTTLDQLNAADPEAADKFLADNPAIAQQRYQAYGELTQKVRDQQAQLLERQKQRDTELLATNPKEWRKASGDDAHDVSRYIDGLYASAGEFKKEPQSLLDVAQAKFHETLLAATDKKTNTVDWNTVDSAVAQMSPAEQELLFKSTLKGETEPRKQYLRDIRQLAPYFDQRDAAWQQISAKSPATLGKYATFDDFRQSIADKIYAKTGSHAIAEAEADNAVSDLGDLVSARAIGFLVRNRNLIPLLDKYGFYVPSVLRPLTVNRSNISQGALATLESP